jgi:hypothetical protein
VSTDLKNVLGPLLALAILAIIGFQTAGALRRSGAWGAPRRATGVTAPDPYARLEGQLAKPVAAIAIATLRDPFDYPHAPAPDVRAVRPRVAPPPMPVLTAILADTDPRAIIRYLDRNYTVKPGDYFADFKVISITAVQVVLDRNGEHMSLRRPTKGE